MTGKVKLSKIEIFLIVLTILAVSFTCGYFVGRGGVSKSVTVTIADNLHVTENLSEKSSEVKKEASNDSKKTAEASVPSGPININTASSDELQTLPSIGSTLAERIIKFREENGWFKSTDEILDVYGIGSSIFEKIKEYITV